MVLHLNKTGVPKSTTALLVGVSNAGQEGTVEITGNWFLKKDSVLTCEFDVIISINPSLSKSPAMTVLGPVPLAYELNASNDKEPETEVFFNTATLELENQLAEATSGFPSASKSVTTKPLGLAVVENGIWVAKLMVPLLVFLNTEIED